MENKINTHCVVFSFILIYYSKLNYPRKVFNEKGICDQLKVFCVVNLDMSTRK